MTVKDEYWYKLIGKPSILGIGRVVTTNYHPNRKTSFFIFGIVVSGTRTILVGETKLFLKPGDYFLLPPNVPHAGIKLDKHDVFFVHFQNKYQLTKTVPQVTISDIILPISGKTPKRFHFVDDFEYLSNENLLKQRDIKLLEIHFHSILSYISEFQQSLLNQSDSNILLAEAINQYIIKNNCKTLSSQDFENRFQLSYKQLNAIFQIVYGNTIKQDVTNQKITYASQLLLAGMSISDVAQKIGYNDYFYFLKVFKKVKGMTPTEYLKFHFKHEEMK